MTCKTLILVSDKFIDFTLDKKAITVSQLSAMLEVPEHILPGKLKLIPGLGISDNDIEELTTKINTHRTSPHRWDVSALASRPRPAETCLSHKRLPHNTLIGTPHQLDENRFRMDLCIDENSELMGDHQTGQHVQGMVLVEASRQAFLAVTEAFFQGEGEDSVYFVINSMTTEFMGFVFPVHSHIDYRVVSKDINDRRKKFSVEIDIIQGGDMRTRSSISFTVYPNRVISKREAALARDTVEVFLSQFQQPASNFVAE
ncbi:AfsA-related hotdog domain-containing protein [Chromohalobacter israelensis]|uniref:AfsA-related hotdog domain-containing protein n=1 Tax=Chromohalobacter israelensis TaxID=141390 RepID=UPI001CC5F897|nr:AfsA-related hotdog domain-containing protein [Chromohalobacter salexigens]MBZ5876801.1 hypothetical protein [Chromohalobacter salexigens]